MFNCSRAAERAAAVGRGRFFFLFKFTSFLLLFASLLRRNGAESEMWLLQDRPLVDGFELRVNGRSAMAEVIVQLDGRLFAVGPFVVERDGLAPAVLSARGPPGAMNVLVDFVAELVNDHVA